MAAAMACLQAYQGVPATRLTQWICSKSATPAILVDGTSAVPDHAESPAAEPSTNAAALVPQPDSAGIARITSLLLTKSHYLQHQIDDEISSKFFDQYLDALDPLHLIFLQTDVKEFEPYRYRLDDLILRRGDTTPAYVIFNRMRVRFAQQVTFVNQLLKTEKFDFTGNERYLYNRRTAPRPKDLEDAKKLWRERVRYEFLQEILNKEKPDEIVKIIERRYTRMQRFLDEYDSGDVFQIYLTALTHAYDPHSDYMGAAQLENFAIGMKLSLFGIGALLKSEDGYCKIVQLVPGGPAEKSKKLKPNDRIIAVAQENQETVDVVDMKLAKVVEMIRGTKGTKVRLTIIPADASDPSTRRVVTLVRDEVKLEEQEAKAKIVELPDRHEMRLGIIDLPSFYSEMPTAEKSVGLKSTTADVARLLHKLNQEKISGLILDLRRNGGGALEEAIDLTGLFIKKGPVVQIKSYDGSISEGEDRDPSVLYDGPMIVLTSHFSASASEILAGALQDYGRAVIVGDSSTFGKGTVQQLIQLEPYMRQFGFDSTNNPGALKLTIRKFYRANGASTQLDGVKPDVCLPSPSDYAEIGESSLPNALPWDTVPSASFQPVNMVQAYLPELKKLSDERLATDPDFIYLRAEIERVKKALADKTISLNEAQRWKEKQEADARQQTRKKELLARPAPDQKVYELTLKQADLPGLPPPLAQTNDLIASVNKNLTSDSDSETKSEDDSMPVVDATMAETERILIDLITLSAKSK
ncbi:MAG: carboxy terminal-processing peptidase [Candidatus Omnitrophica bacterium]|nr:carboxy terminal-processing peptidase [Candidatus Omnitrophota bacterium]